MNQVEPIATMTRSTASADADNVRFEIRHDPRDDAWDDFLARTPGGHHVQSSLWAAVKATRGYRAVRLLARRQGTIVAGIQMLVAPPRYGRSVAYAAKGPVVAPNEGALAAQLLREFQGEARSQRVELLFVQPPDDGAWLEPAVRQAGFAPSHVEVCPYATTVVDLRQGADAVLKAMKQKVRYNIRLALRNRLTARAGSEADLATYYALMVATGQRQGFSVFPEEYYRILWRVFRERDAVRLSIVEHRGEPLAAQLAIAFGDTVLNKMGVWSGRFGEHHPNELLHWSSIEWAAGNGFRRYDLDGISSAAARAAMAGEPLPAELRRSLDSFKLGFGGEAKLLPGTFDFVSRPALRWVYRALAPHLAHSRLAKWALHRFRTH